MKLDNYSQSDSQDSSFSGMTKSRKITIFFLFFIIVVIIFLGFWKIRLQVLDPFRAPEDSSQQIAKNNQLDETIDTDGDGLSDYDETFLYGTSPYLEDTDGDGISDYDEIMQGTDPLCPEGGDCFLMEEFFAEPEESFNPSLEDLEAGLGDISLPEGANESDLEQALKGEIEVDDLRALLIESGADPELLSQVSDEDLLASYQEVLNNNNEE